MKLVDSATDRIIEDNETLRNVFGTIGWIVCIPIMWCTLELLARL